MRCGIITQYADDATYVVSNRDRTWNQQKLSENIENLIIYLETNELTINADKMNLVEVMIQQKRAKITGELPDLSVRNNDGQLETVSDRKYCRILGMNLQNNMTLNNHLETGKKSLLPSLRKNLGALKSLDKQIPQGSRNTMARGLILSRLSYLIGIWSGATEHLMKKAQIVQNSAARKTRITTLLDKTGWNSVQEMSIISSVTQVWKMINLGTPRSLAESLNWNAQNKEIDVQEPRLIFTKQNFKFRASSHWNNLPESLRTNQNLGSFKRQLKVWIKEQRELRPLAPDLR